MRFEEQVTVLCARALAAVDDTEVQEALAELRGILHQRILELRSGLIAAYTAPKLGQDTRNHTGTKAVATAVPWRQIVHEIAAENDHQRALELSIHLSGLLAKER